MIQHKDRFVLHPSLASTLWEDWERRRAAECFRLHQKKNGTNQTGMLVLNVHAQDFQDFRNGAWARINPSTLSFSSAKAPAAAGLSSFAVL